MKKYITTENHPTFRTGIILSVNSGHKISLEDGTIIGISKDAFDFWLSDRWVREMQKPEYTKDQLISFGKYCNTRSNLVFTIEDMFDNWSNK